MPLAVDATAGCLLLAFAPLELKLMRVEVERRPAAAPGGPAPNPVARITTLRDLSILGLGSPLQVGGSSEQVLSGTAWAGLDCLGSEGLPEQGRAIWAGRTL